MPSDFFAVGIAFNLGSQSSREDLRAEAYAEHRQIRFHRVLDQTHLVAQPRIAIGLINAHRTAHHYQAACAFHAHWNRPPSSTRTYCHASAAPSSASAMLARFSTGWCCKI